MSGTAGVAVVAVVGGAVVVGVSTGAVAVVDVSVGGGSSADPAAAKNPAASSAQQPTANRTFSFISVAPYVDTIRQGRDRPPPGATLWVLRPSPLPPPGERGPSDGASSWASWASSRASASSPTGRRSP